MFVNGIPFLVTLLLDVRMFTAEFLPSCTTMQLSSSLTKTVKLYARGGFALKVVMVDMEFEKIMHKVGLVKINPTAACEHVGEIERGICTFKECWHSAVSTLLFSYHHKQLVVHMVYFVCMFLNTVPDKNGISQRYCPCEIVTERKINLKLDCQALFRSYVKARVDADVTNDR